ncbi:uncharacterized protein LOC118438283 [Folsomia candida]|uniref:uncharacterized protein LOC118438283 n=1 Tax=Folsomia candida TaxID=158441 RepID=UPI001604EF2A|nr:uncharacterized protein LOC118438283 [Folsomia candida]
MGTIIPPTFVSFFEYCYHLGVVPFRFKIPKDKDAEQDPIPKLGGGEYILETNLKQMVFCGIVHFLVILYSLMSTMTALLNNEITGVISYFAVILPFVSSFLTISFSSFVWRFRQGRITDMITQSIKYFEHCKKSRGFPKTDLIYIVISILPFILPGLVSIFSHLINYDLSHNFYNYVSSARSFWSASYFHGIPDNSVTSYSTLFGYIILSTFHLTATLCTFSFMVFMQTGLFLGVMVLHEAACAFTSKLGNKSPDHYFDSYTLLAQWQDLKSLSKSINHAMGTLLSFLFVMETMEIITIVGSMPNGDYYADALSLYLIFFSVTYLVLAAWICDEVCTKMRT